MLEQLAISLGLEFRLIVVGLIAGIAIIARSKENVFIKVVNVLVCIFAAGYSNQVFILVGWKVGEETSMIRAFIISMFSPSAVEGILKIGQDFKEDPLKYISNIATKYIPKLFKNSKKNDN